MRKPDGFASLGKMCLVLFLLVAGCSQKPKPPALESAEGAFDELRAAVRSEIKDPDTAVQGIYLVDQLERLVIEANNDRKAHILSTDLRISCKDNLISLLDTIIS
jgi:hypothetical protein